MLVNNAHQTRSAKIAALPQFVSKDLSVAFCGFESRQTTSQFVGKQF